MYMVLFMFEMILICILGKQKTFKKKYLLLQHLCGQTLSVREHMRRLCEAAKMLWRRYGSCTCKRQWGWSRMLLCTVESNLNSVKMNSQCNVLISYNNHEFSPNTLHIYIYRLIALALPHVIYTFTMTHVLPCFIYMSHSR